MKTKESRMLALIIILSVLLAWTVIAEHGVAGGTAVLAISVIGSGALLSVFLWWVERGE